MPGNRILGQCGRGSPRCARTFFDVSPLCGESHHVASACSSSFQRGTTTHGLTELGSIPTLQSTQELTKQLYAVHCTPRAGRCTLYTARGTLGAARCTLGAARCVLHTTRGAVHSTSCALGAAHCAMHAARWAQCTLYIGRCPLCTALCALAARCALGAVHFALCTAQRRQRKAPNQRGCENPNHNR